MFSVTLSFKLWIVGGLISINGYDLLRLQGEYYQAGYLAMRYTWRLRQPLKIEQDDGIPF